MGIVDRLRALFGGGAKVSDHAEEDVDAADRARREREDFEGVRDDDAIARGTTSTGSLPGPGTPTEVYKEFDADQEAPRNPGQ
jgi:hypothetical protein